MAEHLQLIVGKISDFVLGVKRDNSEVKNEKVTYTITSVFPSKKSMEEIEKYL